MLVKERRDFLVKSLEVLRKSQIQQAINLSRVWIVHSRHIESAVVLYGAGDVRDQLATHGVCIFSFGPLGEVLGPLKIVKAEGLALPGLCLLASAIVLGLLCLYIRLNAKKVGVSENISELSFLMPF